jgi:hypothetical protein
MKNKMTLMHLPDLKLKSTNFFFVLCIFFMNYYISTSSVFEEPKYLDESESRAEMETAEEGAGDNLLSGAISLYSHHVLHAHPTLHDTDEDSEDDSGAALDESVAPHGTHPQAALSLVSADDELKNT